MPPVLTRNGDNLELALAGCRGFEFQDAYNKIREVEGRHFDFDRKLWIVEATAANAERILKSIQPEADPELVAWVRDAQSQAEVNLTTSLPDDGTLLVPWATQRMPWQPEFVNDEPFDGALPHQRAAIDAMAVRGRAVLADDMGLGKTFEGITAVEEWVLRHTLADGVTKPEGPKLVVAPSSVMGGWARELHRWLEDPAVVLVDSKTPAKRHQQVTEAIQNDAWCIVNWEQLRIQKLKFKTRNGGQKTLTLMKEPLFEWPHMAYLDLTLDEWQDPSVISAAERELKRLRGLGDESVDWLAVIADEVHRGKNPDAQQTKGLWRTTGRVMYGLTGTPLMNSPDELWSVLRWLWPHEFHERGEAFSPGALAFWTFYNEYVDFWEDHFGKKVITGVKNPDALRFVLKDKLIRRTSEILGLKGRKRIFYPVPLNPKQQKLYDEAERQMWLQVLKEAEAGDKSAVEFAAKAVEGADLGSLYRIPNGAARFVRLRQIIETPATLGGDDDSALLDDFMQKYEDSRPEPWTVFVEFKATCEALAARIRRAGGRVAVYNGDVAKEDRTKIEDAFQRGEIDVVVGTVKAMKEGITLTRSHLMYFASRDVVPDVNEQCEAREDRLGQQKLVMVYIPQAEDTVATSRIAPINDLKAKIVRTVVPKAPIEEVHLS